MADTGTIIDVLFLWMIGVSSTSERKHEKKMKKRIFIK